MALEAKMKRLKNAWHVISTPSSKDLPYLDVLRSLAIALVVCNHLGHFFIRFDHFPVINYGWTGVDLFFVLSGFLIGGQVWREISGTRSLNLKRFILRRGLRIWPLYFVFVGFVLIKLWAAHLSVLRAFSDIVFLSNYVHHGVVGGWSLSTEEQFYICFPLLAMLLCRRLSPKKLVVIPIAWLVSLPLLRWLTVRAAGLSGLAAQKMVYSPFHTHSDGLAIGVLLSWIVVFKPDWAGHSQWKVACLSVPFIAVALVLRSIGPDYLFAYSALALIYGSATFWAICAKRVPALFRRKEFHIVSRLSYGMYLNHVYIMGLLSRSLFIAMGSGIVGYCISGVVVWMLSIIVAFVTFALVELPFLDYRERWLKRITPLASAVKVAG